MKVPEPGRPLPASFFARPPAEVARALLGARLVRRLPDGERLVLRLVETEAYLGASDRASHAWAGRRTVRNASLYLPAGHAYVYFIYGLHYCLNVVTNPDGRGGAVLLRAGEALAGTERMLRHRGLTARHPPGARRRPGRSARRSRSTARSTARASAPASRSRSSRASRSPPPRS